MHDEHIYSQHLTQHLDRKMKYHIENQKEKEYTLHFYGYTAWCSSTCKSYPTCSQAVATKEPYIHQLSSCCIGSHLLIVVGCVVEWGEVTSEVGGITFGVDGADTGESVQVVTEQGSGEE